MLYSHVWLFEGAEGGGWLQQLKRELGMIDIGDSGVGDGMPATCFGDKCEVRVDDDGERETKKRRVM